MEAIRDGILKGTKNDQVRLKEYMDHQDKLRKDYHRDRNKRWLPSWLFLPNTAYAAYGP